MVSTKRPQTSQFHFCWKNCLTKVGHGDQCHPENGLSMRLVTLKVGEFTSKGEVTNTGTGRWDKILQVEWCKSPIFITTTKYLWLDAKKKKRFILAYGSGGSRLRGPLCWWLCCCQSPKVVQDIIRQVTGSRLVSMCLSCGLCLFS